MSNTVIYHPSSYQDPSGFIFETNGILYRQVNSSFKEHFDYFIQGGCYDQLVKKALLVPHTDVPENLTGSPEFYRTIRPERIEFISFPYEWSFDMLKDAALLTLQLVKEGLQHDMILKDATAYNIQWHRGKFVLIDTLSFEKYRQVPWIAYRQFCEAFLGPLLIMHYCKKHLPELLLSWPNGIPLYIVSSILPKRSWLSLFTYLHIHLHAKYSEKKKGQAGPVSSFSKQKLLNLLGSLESLINKLQVPEQKSTWSEYYREASQRNNYLEQKKEITSGWIQKMNGIKNAADLGANEGEFSKILASANIPVVAADFDPYCINRLYQQIKKTSGQMIQPVVIDLSSPSPSLGVNNKERDSFIGRSRFDLLLALAMIHHLAIGKNIPFSMIAEMLSRMGSKLIIEFVPKHDEKVKLMLDGKKDIYMNYNEEHFTSAFEKFFSVIDKKIIPGSGRVLYLMQKHEK